MLFYPPWNLKRQIKSTNNKKNASCPLHLTSYSVEKANTQNKMYLVRKLNHDDFVVHNGIFLDPLWWIPSHDSLWHQSRKWLDNTTSYLISFQFDPTQKLQNKDANQKDRRCSNLSIISLMKQLFYN